MGMIFPVLGEGSSSEIFISGIRGKYLDSRLSCLNPFPTLFKGSTRRRIEGLELIYRRAIPLLVPETLNLTRYIDKKYFLNTENRVNISVSFHPTVGYCSSSPERFWGSVARAERDPGISPNLYRRPQREREISPNLRYSLPVTFQRGFSAFDAGPRQKYRAAHPENLYPGVTDRNLITGSDVRSRMMAETRSVLEGADRQGMIVSDVQGRTIVSRPPENLLSEDWFRVSSPIKFRTEETRHALEGADRRHITESDGRSRTIVTRPLENHLSQDWFRVTSPIKFRTGERRRGLKGADRRGMTESDISSRTIVTMPPTLIYKQLSGGFEEGSEMATHLSTIDPVPLVVHGGPPSMSKPSFNKGEGPKELSQQLYESGLERSPSLDFAEDLKIISAGIKTASDLTKARRRYPELEHVEPVQAKILREREVLKEKITEPDLGRKSIALDLNRISDQVYSMIERRVRIERERRGLYG